MQPAVDISGAIRKAEIETRRSKSGGNFDVLVLTLSNAEKIEITSFSPLDRGYFSLLKILSRAAK